MAEAEFYLEGGKWRGNKRVWHLPAFPGHFPLGAPLCGMPTGLGRKGPLQDSERLCGLCRRIAGGDA